MQKQGGISVKVDLGKLIDAVWVAPFTDPWFLQLTEDIVGESGSAVPVNRSDIDTNPYIG